MEWRVRPGDDSMRSMAHDLQQQIRERAKKAGSAKKKTRSKGGEEKEEKGLTINIVNRVRSDLNRR